MAEIIDFTKYKPVRNYDDEKNQFLHQNFEVSEDDIEESYNYSDDLLFCIKELFKVDNKIAKLSNKKFAFFKNTRLKKLKAYKHKIRIGVLTFYYLWDNIYTSFDEAHAHAKKDVYIEGNTSGLKLPNII